jgi:toxin ParE1/3/4
MAEADLAEIWAYIADDSEQSASRMLTAIEAVFTRLKSLPFSSPLREQLAPGLRVTFLKNYAIYYRPYETDVVIIRVLHGARDANAIADGSGFAVL